MVRELAGDLVLRSRVALLEPLRGLAVEAVAILRDEGAVRGLLDQDVLEAELRLRPTAAFSEEVEPLELHERVPRASVADHRVEQRETELPPEHGSGRERVVRRRVEAVDAREDHLLDRRRDLHLDRVVEAPALLAVHERAGVDEGADELLQEERVALRRLDDAALHLLRERSLADERVEELPP